MACSTALLQLEQNIPEILKVARRSATGVGMSTTTAEYGDLVDVSTLSQGYGPLHENDDIELEHWKENLSSNAYKLRLKTYGCEWPRL